jgi:hypothetical protein
MLTIFRHPDENPRKSYAHCKIMTQSPTREKANSRKKLTITQDDRI